MRTIHALLLASLIALSGRASAAQSPLAGADQRIEQYRKADATIYVVDASGEPVPDARVRVEQLRHQFLFGCAAISLLKHKNINQEDLYERRLGNLFNFATILAYWQDTDPEPGKSDYSRLMNQAKRLREMGITVKGHPLILAGAMPTWAPPDPDVVRELNRKRIEQLASRTRGLIDIWDVVGDATTAQGAQNGLGAWARKAGPASFTADALRWARAANPRALLMYNDYKLDSTYPELIRRLFDMGAPLDALGLEAHMGDANWSMARVWNTCEDYNRLGKPLHFSEITVLSDDPTADHKAAWPSTQEGEKRQAEYVEQLYTILFSHPGVQAISWWNLVDGDWDRQPGGLLHADLSPKPAYDLLMKLIKGKWWTTVDGIADSGGRVQMRGFAGRYRVTVTTQTSNGTVDVDILRGQTNNVKVRLP